MTQQQVFDVLKKEQCTIQGTNTIKFESLPNEPMTFGVQCAAPGYSQQIKVGLTGAPAPSRMFGVYREVRAPQNQPLALSNLLRSLREKYGKEAMLDTNIKRAAWFFDQSGKPTGTPRIAGAQPTSIMLSICPGFTGSNAPHQYNPNQKNLDAGSQIGANLNPACGVAVIVAWWADSNNKDLVTQFTISLTDHHVWMKSLQELNQYLTKAENAYQSKKKQQAVKQGGPRL
jgi:hypothetical protein